MIYAARRYQGNVTRVFNVKILEPFSKLVKIVQLHSVMLFGIHCYINCEQCKDGASAEHWFAKCYFLLKIHRRRIREGGARNR